MTTTAFIGANGFVSNVSPSTPLPVNIGSATLSVTADGVEIKNDAGNPIPVSDNSSSLTVDGKAYRTTATITRPSNTTAYTAGDVVGDTGGSAIISLTAAGPTAGFVIIQSISLVFSDSTVPSDLRFRPMSPPAGEIRSGMISSGGLRSYLVH